ncbi:hypothetical protein [Streptomyces sp. NPDC021356]|uniref:hypothetical protein n=1 Tax=Streptomyces sp. NPDC021356 TaxID=3154900 RepID=UPI00340BCB68
MKSAGGTDRQLLLVSAGETATVVVIGAVLGVLVTLPPPAGLASGLFRADSTDVGLHLDTATLAAAIAGPCRLPSRPGSRSPRRACAGRRREKHGRGGARDAVTGG